MKTLLITLLLLAACSDRAAPPPPPPPAPPPPPTGGPCEYHEVSLACLPARIESTRTGLRLTYRDPSGGDMRPIDVAVPADRIDEARTYYSTTGATCTASVIDTGSCPPILHPAVTPPPPLPPAHL